MIGTLIKKELILCDIWICYSSFQYSYLTITFLEKTITKYFMIKSISIDKGLPL